MKLANIIFCQTNALHKCLQGNLLSRLHKLCSQSCLLFSMHPISRACLLLKGTHAKAKICCFKGRRHLMLDMRHTMQKDKCWHWKAKHTCCSKGAMPGTKSIAVNSMVPSTLKCEWARGSRNSLKVCLKKASYSSLPTCVNTSKGGLNGLAKQPLTAKELFEKGSDQSLPTCVPTTAIHLKGLGRHCHASDARQWYMTCLKKAWKSSLLVLCHHKQVKWLNPIHIGND